jgi:CheY-like chemotaxis protein
MATDGGALCALCHRALSPHEIDSGETVMMGSLKDMHWACLSHFYSDLEQNKRAPNYQHNVDVMAMSVVWAERRTTDAECYREMDGGHILAGRRALVVDDHWECAELMKIILEEEGCEVRCAGTGGAALEVLTSNLAGQAPDFDPDLVLLDLRLPDMSGVDCVEELRKRRSAIPLIVMISAYPSVYQAANSIGVICLRKPFDFVSLFSAIASARHSREAFATRR